MTVFSTKVTEQVDILMQKKSDPRHRPYALHKADLNWITDLKL